MPLPKELEAVRAKIEGHARDYGLDFFDTIFEVLDFKQINEVASYGGFPTRYPHWRFGMEYERMEKGYAYGLQKIYEMVINNDPCYAYLLRSNNLVDQKIVMAHVYAHCDFFKMNNFFAKTNRKMMDEMANHGSRIQRYIDRFGIDCVESFVDACLSIENLIDIHSPFIARPYGQDEKCPGDGDDGDHVRRIKSKAYMDSYINPKEFLEAQEERMREERTRTASFPKSPERDVLLFLIESAPINSWQRDILSMVREEGYYFAPQAQTKIMNEGWATYWHSKIMTRKCLEDWEVVDYADHHSGTVATSPGRVNPYKIGLELFRDIEDRWNKGKFGSEYDACDDMTARKAWDRQLGLGREKIFEVRRLYNDLTFIDAFLTEEFCREQKLFTYAFNPKTEYYEIASRQFAEVKKKLLFALTNFGQPIIRVVDGNYSNSMELYLEHQYEGGDLMQNQAMDTLKNLHRIWTRPVHIETVSEGKKVLLSFDGQEHSTRAL